MESSADRAIPVIGGNATTTNFTRTLRPPKKQLPGRALWKLIELLAPSIHYASNGRRPPLRSPQALSYWIVNSPTNARREPGWTASASASKVVEILGLMNT